MTKYTYGILETAKLNFQQTSKRLNLEGGILNRLLEPKEKIEITLNPTLTSGKHI